MAESLIEAVEIMRPRGLTKYWRRTDPDGYVAYLRWETFGGGWKRVPSDQHNVRAEIDKAILTHNAQVQPRPGGAKRRQDVGWNRWLGGIVTCGSN